MRDTLRERGTVASTDLRQGYRQSVAVHWAAVRSMSRRQVYRLVLLAAVFPGLTRVFPPVTTASTVGAFVLAGLFVVVVVRGRVHIQTRNQISTINHFPSKDAPG